MPHQDPLATPTGVSVARMATRAQSPFFVNAPPAVAAIAVEPLAPQHVTPPEAAPDAERKAKIASVLTAPIQDLKAIAPDVAGRISAIPHAVDGGVVRSALTVPVAPDDVVSNTTLLEDPRDPAKKYFVTGYALHEETSTRGQQFSIRLTASGATTQLSVTITKAPPADLLRTAPGAQEMEHRVSLLLQYKQRVNGIPSAQAEIAFTAANVDGDTIHGRLVVEGLGKRQELYYALSDPELACVLVVRRMVRVAVRAIPRIPPRIDMLDLGPSVPMRPGAAIRRQPGEVEDIPERPDPRPRPRPVPPPPDPPPPLYRETDRVVDLGLPFTFDRQLHGYIYEGVGASVPGPSQGLLRRQIAWNGLPHIYYQSDSAKNQFFYQPDTFKLARRPDVPHKPFLSVRFDSPDGSREAMRVTCTYCAVPVVNRERLAAALPAMKSMVPPDVLAAAGGIELEPLLPDPARTKLKIAYPGADTAEGPFVHRTQAAVDLRAGVVDALSSLTLDQFRALFDAMCSSGQLLGTGMIAFDMGGIGEEIPFKLRLNDTAEPLVSWVQAAQGGAAAVTVTNQIESTLRVQQMDAVTDAASLSVRPLEVVDGSYPVLIEPKKSVQFRLAGAGADAAIGLDLFDVETIPDRAALYDAALDPSTVPAYLRPIKVKAFPATFAVPADDPRRQVLSLVVDFDNLASVELTPTQLEVPVKVSVPLAGFILGTELSQKYRYKVTVVRSSGIVTDEDWKAGESGVLFPVVG